MSFVFRAFSNGADGVYVGGCWPGECHYVTEGNYDALFNMHLGRKLLEQIGVNPKRLRLEWTASSEGTRYAEIMNDFGRQLTSFGPLGSGEGLDPGTLRLKLAAVTKLIPYIKLVERERLRVRFDKQEKYEAYFSGEEFHRLFDELVAEQLANSEIMLLLREDTRPAREIARVLGLEPAAVSRHLNKLSELGLVRFDAERKSYALA